MQRVVEWRDIDPMQHVNTATDLAYMDDCGVQVSRDHGWSMDRMISEGFGIITRRNRIDYRQPAVLDDDLIITTRVSGVRNSSATRHYAITRADDGALLAQANALYVWVDSKSRKPIRIPDCFLKDFAENIVD
jgi:acyl-CoA thioester hydrolase